VKSGEIDINHVGTFRSKNCRFVVSEWPRPIGGAPAYMLWAAASFDLRQHFVDDGIFRKRFPEGRIQALQ
jgi:hypothetical protein